MNDNFECPDCGYQVGDDLLNQPLKKARQAYRESRALIKSQAAQIAELTTQLQMMRRINRTSYGLPKDPVLSLENDLRMTLKNRESDPAIRGFAAIHIKDRVREWVQLDLIHPILETQLADLISRGIQIEY